jgi:hypothetical protein
MDSSSVIRAAVHQWCPRQAKQNGFGSEERNPMPDSTESRVTFTSDFGTGVLPQTPLLRPFPSLGGAVKTCLMFSNATAVRDLAGNARNCHLVVTARSFPDLI